MAFTTATPFASREVLNLVITDYATGKPLANLNYANTTSTELTGEAVHAYGGWGHPKKVSFTGEKSGTFTVETQLFTFELYRIVSGGEISKTASFIKRVEIAATEAGKLTLTTAPTGTPNVFALEDDCGTEIKGSWAQAVFTATTPDEIAEGKTYVVYYLENLADKVTRLSITQNSNPKAVKMYGDTVVKTENEELIPYKMVVYKATPQLNFSIANSNNGDPISLTMTFDLAADKDGNMVDLLLIEE